MRRYYRYNNTKLNYVYNKELNFKNISRNIRARKASEKNKIWNQYMYECDNQTKTKIKLSLF